MKNRKQKYLLGCYALVVFCLMFSIESFGQNIPSYGKIGSYAKKKSNRQFKDQYKESQVVNWDLDVLSQVLQQKRPYFEIQIPTLNKKVPTSLVLQKVELFSPNESNRFYLENRKVFNYQGVVKNKKSSIVSINIGPNGISGIISDDSGNLVIQPVDEQGQSVIFYETAINKPIDRTCHQLNEEEDLSFIKNRVQHNKSLSTITPLTVYFECDHQMFLNNNSSVIETMDYVAGLFNQVAAIYSNEGIPTLIESIKVWDEQDPYSIVDAESALISFRDSLDNEFEGDFAHLLSGVSNNNGGVAILNALCDKTKAYAYSNIFGTYDGVPSYSLDVHIVSHELGHNFGSPHTHECIWGPNNDSPLDNCALPSSDCDLGPAPVNGGTIMSYCHNSEYGVNFSLGFGPEPGDLIRDLIMNCQNMEGYICYKSKEITTSGEYHASGPTVGSGAKHSSAIHANWFSFIPVIDGQISISSCNRSTDTRLFIYSGKCYRLNEIANSDDDCHSGGGNFYASNIENMSVQAGISYYIEWDDAWTDEGFLFQFDFIPTNDPCGNGVMDADETGIDCGGTLCAPCDACPNSDTEMSQLITDNTTYRSSDTLVYNGTVEGGLILSSEQSIELLAGFEIQAGATFEAIIEDCDNFAHRIGN